MPKRCRLKINKPEVDGLSVEGRDRVFWDSALPGFGVRVYPTGRKIYLAQASSSTGVKRVSLGRHGTVPGGEARKRAVAAIVRGGEAEGKAPELTVAALAERYMEALVAVDRTAKTTSRLLKNPPRVAGSKVFVGLFGSSTLRSGVGDPRAAGIGAGSVSGGHQLGASAMSLGSRTRL